MLNAGTVNARRSYFRAPLFCEKNRVFGRILYFKNTVKYTRIFAINQSKDRPRRERRRHRAKYAWHINNIRLNAIQRLFCYITSKSNSVPPAVAKGPAEALGELKWRYLSRQRFPAVPARSPRKSSRTDGQKRAIWIQPAWPPPAVPYLPEPRRKNGARRRRSHNRCGVRLFQGLGRSAKAVVQAEANCLKAGVEVIRGYARRRIG